MGELVQVRQGDMFETRAHVLVNTVNTVGIMGKGIALEFKRRYPAMYRDYVKRCQRGEVKLGQPYLYRDLVTPGIINFPTKVHWRSVSRVEDIVAGLDYLERHIGTWQIESLAVPPLGCGNGGLEWSVVGPTLYRHLGRLGIPVELFAPHGTPAAQMTREFLDAAPIESINSDLSIRTGRVNPSWIGIAEIVGQISKLPYHWTVGHTMFQKIAYFATAFGIPTELKYVRGSYGPFAPGLKQVLSKLVNNGVLVEQPRSSLIEVKPGRTLTDARAAYASELADWEPAIASIVDLMSRLTGHQAEMAATIHFVVHELTQDGKRPVEADVLREVMRWKQERRPKWDEAEVAVMIRHLAMLRVIDVRPTDELTHEDEFLLGVTPAGGVA